MTRHPTAEWVVQQLHEAFPEARPYRYVILVWTPNGRASGVLAKRNGGALGGELPKN